MIPKKKKSCWYKNTVAHTTYAHEIIALNGFRPFIFLPWEHPMHVNACFLRNFHTSDSIPFHFISFRWNEYVCFVHYEMKFNHQITYKVFFSKFHSIFEIQINIELWRKTPQTLFAYTKWAIVIIPMKFYK